MIDAGNHTSSHRSSQSSTKSSQRSKEPRKHCQISAGNAQNRQLSTKTANICLEGSRQIPRIMKFFDRDKEHVHD